MIQYFWRIFYLHSFGFMTVVHYHNSVRQDDTFNPQLHLFYPFICSYKIYPFEQALILPEC